MWAGPSGARPSAAAQGSHAQHQSTRESDAIELSAARSSDQREQRALPRRASVSQALPTDMRAGTEFQQVAKTDSFSVPELKGANSTGPGGLNPGGLNIKAPHTQKQVDPPKTILDRLIMVIVIAGAIVFAYFQVGECIRAHESPSSQTFVANVERMYPGFMICPFSIDNMRETGICPKWSPQALLSFEFGEGTYLDNTNFDSASNRQSASKCSNNIRSLIPASLDASLYIQSSSRNPTQVVTVKNQGSRVSPLCPDHLGLKNVCAQQNIPEFCDGWTPPNVQCLVLDPVRTDYLGDCNPMKEVRANSVDFLRFTTGTGSYGIYTEPGKGRRVDSFTYNGLEKFWQVRPSPQPKPTTPPSSATVSTYDLLRQAGQANNLNVTMSMFGGLVAVFYDASQGIPQVLDFERAQDNSMSSSIVGSTVLFSVDCPNSQPGCTVTVRPPQTVTVSIQIDQEFTNAVTGKSKNVSKVTADIRNTDVPIPRPRAAAGSAVDWNLFVKFSSSATVVTKQVVKLSILTAASLIFSTAGTLWGSQQKIKDGIIQISTKVKQLCGAKSDPLAQV